jgi:hypothetical protein
MDVAKVDRGMLHMLHILQLFHRHVASVCFECFIYSRGMFHLCFLTHVASVFIWMLHMFHTYICCMRFIWMLRIVAMVFKCFQVFFQVL